MHIAEAGAGGPVVILLHGFPELWYSWRHQIPALASAGYHTVAVDQRGYGQTTIPAAVTDYDIVHLTRDVVDLIDHIGVERAVVVGHDFGALVAWAVALCHPDRVSAVAGLSVPYVPRTPSPPMQFFRDMMGEDFYMLWLQQPGMADTLFHNDIERALAGQWVTDRENWQSGPTPERFPWRSTADQERYIDAFQRNGFTGPLNWYRNFDRNWELLSAFDDRTIDCPAMFLGGQNDPVLQFMPPALMADKVTDLRVSTTLPNVNHWIQEEAPQQVNQHLVAFVDGVQDHALPSSAH